MTSSAPRHIFFVHGFDRRGPRHFNLWQKREARLYDQRFGQKIRVGERVGNSWEIARNQHVTKFTYLDWTSIVQARFGVGVWRVVWDLVSIGLAGARQGFFGRILYRDWALGLLLLWGFLPLFTALVALVILLFFQPIFALTIPVALCGVIAFAIRQDGRLGLAYVLHIAWAARRIALRDHADLERYVIESAEEIDALPEEAEVLIVGHSIGAALAVRIAAAAERPVSLLTVGSSALLVSAQKDAGDMRQDIEKAAKNTWIDVSARKDMLGCLALDVTENGGVKCVTVNLKRSFGKKLVKSLRFDGFGMHFLYFRANLQASPWDWMDLISGPRPISEVFEGASRRSGKGERRFLF